MAKDEAKTNGTAVAEPTPAPVDPETEKANLLAELKKAFDSGDYKAIAAASRKLDQFERQAEKAATEKKLAALKGLGEEVTKVIMKAVQPLIDSKKLDEADGIWFAYDFGDKQPVTRLTKTAAKARSGGGGGVGKKFDVTTESLLEKYGGDEMKDGQTYQQVWDSNTDKNSRYTVRKELLKKEGLL